jgi:hypothetical protein
MRLNLLSSVVSQTPSHFSTLSHKRRDFQTIFTEHKICILIFSTIFLNVFHSKNNSARYYHKCEKSSLSVPRYSCHILIKLEIINRFFDEGSNIKFNQKSSSESRVVPYGRTDTTKLIVIFRNLANVPRN